MSFFRTANGGFYGDDDDVDEEDEEEEEEEGEEDDVYPRFKETSVHEGLTYINTQMTKTVCLQLPKILW